MWRGRPAWAEIDLDAIEHNVRQIRLLIGQHVELLAVVKANAYGHGAGPVAKAALEAGANRLGVAIVDEGVQLRRAGIKHPILVLGYIPPWQANEVVGQDLMATVNTWQTALALSARASALGREATVHVKVDTGLGRFGLLPHEVLKFVRGLLTLPSLRLEGFWTHFATADEKDKEYTRRQLAVYHEALKSLSDAGISIPCRHVANSAATLEMPESHLDMVRCGIALYGLYPSVEVGHAVALQPAMSLKARLARVRELPVGSSVSYGRKFVADRPTLVGLVPFGYADGFDRGLSSVGSVIVRGRRAPVIGRVCMDQFVVNLQDVSGAAQDDEVVIIGRQGDEEITADEVALAAATINYEIVCGIGARVPRVYIKDGAVVGVTGLLD
ncbi:MAG: alanine racemase [Chloroflexota bacterium]